MWIEKDFFYGLMWIEKDGTLTIKVTPGRFHSLGFVTC
jgi:hypothetical protein